jgi:hypothetical protein
VHADPGVLEAPALALFRAIPLVCVEIEDLDAESLGEMVVFFLERLDIMSRVTKLERRQLHLERRPASKAAADELVRSDVDVLVLQQRPMFPRAK